MDQASICPSCHAIVDSSYYFCPNCGKKLKDKPLSTSLGKQITLYAESFFLPPFGLSPSLKYLRQGDRASKRIGAVALALTFISIAATIWIITQYINTFNQTLQTQFAPYQNLGY